MKKGTRASMLCVKLGRSEESRAGLPRQGRHLLACLLPCRAVTEQGMRTLPRALNMNKGGKGWKRAHEWACRA